VNIMNNARIIGKWMTENRNVLVAGAALAVGAGAVFAAVWRQMRPSESTFILEAYSNGLAEISSAELALQKTTSSNVKAFAQHMIDEHGDLNKELHAMADRKNLHLVDTTRLTDKTKAFLLKSKEGQSFDEAYLEHEVNTHKQTITLFRRASNCKDPDVRYFAALTLNKLNSHLKMTQKLLKAVQEYRVIKPMQQKRKELGNGTSVPSLAAKSEIGQHPN
jgi:putative membrane protein